MYIKSIEIQGESGKAYTISAHLDGVVMCTCPAWKFSAAAPSARECKHVKFVKETLSK